MFLLLWLACRPATQPDADLPVNPTLTTPTIAQGTLRCDVDRSLWTVDLTATSWTGGGTLYWTIDGVYGEAHPIHSIAEGADGSSDTLIGTVGIVVDWRAAASTGATVFRCTDDPSFRIVIADTAAQVADCGYGGPNPALLDAIEGVPACTKPLPPPPDTGAPTDTGT